MRRFPKDNFLFLETNRFDTENYRSFLFSDPVKIITCYRLEDVEKSFLEMEDFISNGFYAAGFISYEAGFSFEDTLHHLITKDSSYPLMWFGIFKDPYIFSHREKMSLVQYKDSTYTIKNLQPNISRKDYVRNIERIKDFIRKGDTYQVNYTFKYRFDFSGSIYSFYNALKEKQSVSYSAIIKTPLFSILSLSPELFFRKDKLHIAVRPMKGTLERGRDLERDTYNMGALGKSLKDRSENVMIVDLLRNDLGRISEPGSVKTEKLFEVERYETLLQMVSIVRSTLKKDITIYDLFKAIFPSGSVTGAPKISTMKIINSLEKEPRRVYTGSIGFFAPDGKAVFNVAIRTLLIDNKINKGEMGVGSGIVYDSDPYKEFEECTLKANFITHKKERPFKLIETMLWRPGKGYFLLRYHLDRLFASAEYFNFKCDKKYVIGRLKNLEKDFNNNSEYRVRILLDKDGRIDSAFSKPDNNIKTPKARFSTKKTSSGDIFLYHKTTNRILYDEEYKKWSKKGYFDTIFTNEKNQITEGSISNIVIKKGKFFYTPSVDCGLLNGVFRRHLFETMEIPVKEKVLYKKDIRAADELFMVNSVRGMVKVVL